MKTIYFLSALLLICFAPIKGFSQLSASEIDTLVENAMKEFNVAGTAVAVVKDGKVVYSKGFGVKSAETKTKVDANTNFAIASNSKAFTTAALAMLVEEGKLNWTDKVKIHIPEFKMYNDYTTENFNIQDLLTHRSGLGLGIGDLMWFPDGHNFTIDDIISSFEHFKPVSAFRTKYDYDNLLYLIAGEVIKRTSGLSWEDYIQTKILTPLSMNNTYPSITKMRDKSNLALPHTTNSGSMEVLNSYEKMVNGAAAGLYANVNDLSKWMIMHLNKGKYGADLKKELFSEKSQQEMWTIHTTTRVNRSPRYNSHFAGYGLGWNLTDKNGSMQVSHTGGMPGMLSTTVMIPDLNMGVVVLTNTEAGGAGVFLSVSRAIVDSYLGLDDYNWTKIFSDYFSASNTKADSIVDAVWNTVEKNKKNKVDLYQYIGTYEDNWFGEVEVFMKNKQLWIECKRSPKLNGPMYFYKANSFAIKWEYTAMKADAFAMFNLNEEGQAIGFKMKGISPNIDFSFDFEDLDLKRIK